MSTQTVPTYDVLKALGFAEFQSDYSDPPGGLIHNFEDFDLEAIHCMNPQSMQYVVHFSGMKSTSRTMQLIEFEMPQKVESFEQGVARLTFQLDQNLSGAFAPTAPVPWLELGRANQHTLPWLRKQAEYRPRAECAVDRDWARLGLRRLADLLAQADDSVLVDFCYDGEILRIHILDQIIAMSAAGKAWPRSYQLPAGSLRRLPKRLGRDPVVWTIWDSVLGIGDNRYSGIIQID